MLEEALTDNIGEAVNSRLREENVQAAAKVILNAMPIDINGEEGALERAIEDMDYLAKLDIPFVPEKMQEIITAEGNIFKMLDENNEKFESLVGAQRKRERNYFYDILNQAYGNPALAAETGNDYRMHATSVANFETLIGFIAVNSKVTKEEIIDGFSDKNILDVGYGVRHELVDYLKIETRGNVYGIDPALPEGLEGQGLFKGTVQEDLARFSSKLGIKFDIIVSTGFFNEEMPGVRSFRGQNFQIPYELNLNYAKEIKKVLKPGGRMYVAAGAWPNLDFEKAFRAEGFEVTNVSLREDLAYYLLILQGTEIEPLQISPFEEILTYSKLAGQHL
ncbi:MAG: class I SAM-dependent methyltransferase [Candidatus Omnitrophica bacterium]|nr:class I SAM-dependent methyltransferase [Candidatus Omnitrophota bacterium]